MTPRASVVMAVYNGDAFLAEALGSVLAQTLPELELIVVDDGSTDLIAEILAAVCDRRVRVIRNESNLGLAASLNRGIAASRGPYVARLDADDVCDPDRLRRQVAHLDSHPELAILGTAMRVVGANATADGTIWPVPGGPLAVRFACLLRTPFFHPTVMFRRAAFAEQVLAYDPRLAPAEDYGLWARALRSLDGANLPEPLVTYRIHSDQMTSTRRRLMTEMHDRVALSVIAHELPGHHVTTGEVTNMRRVYVGGGDGPCDSGSATRSFLDLVEAFASVHAGHRELGDVRREAAARALRVTVSLGRDGRLPGLLTRILRMEPTLPFHALRMASRRVPPLRAGPAR